MHVSDVVMQDRQTSSLTLSNGEKPYPLAMQDRHTLINGTEIFIHAQ